MFCFFFFFFFQAEDGIRDTSVTGVQTCALPISERAVGGNLGLQSGISPDRDRELGHAVSRIAGSERATQRIGQIGRASCRERVEISEGAGSLKKKKESRRKDITKQREHVPCS